MSLKNKPLIVKCSHYKHLFSATDFSSHKCDVSFNDVIEIPVVYFSDMSYDKKKIIEGMGVDGVLYSFVIEKRKPIPIIEHIRRKETPWKSDVDETEPQFPTKQAEQKTRFC